MNPFPELKKPGSKVHTPGQMAQMVQTDQLPVLWGRRIKKPNAPAMVYAREKSIRQHIPAFCVAFANRNILHSPFRFLAAILIAFTYYVNRHYRIHLFFHCISCPIQWMDCFPVKQNSPAFSAGEHGFLIQFSVFQAFLLFLR